MVAGLVRKCGRRGRCRGKAVVVVAVRVVGVLAEVASGAVVTRTAAVTAVGGNRIDP